MANHRENRRTFLKAAAGAFVAGTAAANAAPSKNDRARIGAIGMRYQGSVITEKAQAHGDIVAISDVDRKIAEKARAQFGGKADLYENYRDLLDRSDIDAIMIGTPDHWHTKMLIDACRAGKDVYCEKPLTLTIAEGQALRRAIPPTKAVVQVGTWQRSDHRFRLAVEMVRAGRLGKLRRIIATTDKNPTGGPFIPTTPPSYFNWDLWQGQTPNVPYIKERSHYTFRWWYEYSGGKMTDWGAHHIDIAQWAINEYPSKIETKANIPAVGTKSYNVATDFQGRILYPSGVELLIRDEGRRGLLIEGDEGRIFVNRAVLDGAPVDALKNNPLKREEYQLYAHDNLSRPPRAGKLDAIVNHMGNFFDCVRTRQPTLSDIESQHRSVSTCHLANISMRLGRPLQWDATKERFINDKEADTWLAREQREPYKIDA